MPPTKDPLGDDRPESLFRLPPLPEGTVARPSAYVALGARYGPEAAVAGFLADLGLGLARGAKRQQDADEASAKAAHLARMALDLDITLSRTAGLHAADPEGFERAAKLTRDEWLRSIPPDEQEVAALSFDRKVFDLSQKVTATFLARTRESNKADLLVAHNHAVRRVHELLREGQDEAARDQGAVAAGLREVLLGAGHIDAGKAVSMAELAAAGAKRGVVFREYDRLVAEGGLIGAHRFIDRFLSTDHPGMDAAERDVIAGEMIKLTTQRLRLENAMLDRGERADEETREALRKAFWFADTVKDQSRIYDALTPLFPASELRDMVEHLRAGGVEGEDDAELVADLEEMIRLGKVRTIGQARAAIALSRERTGVGVGHRTWREHIMPLIVTYQDREQRAAFQLIDTTLGLPSEGVLDPNDARVRLAGEAKAALLRLRRKDPEADLFKEAERLAAQQAEKLRVGTRREIRRVEAELAAARAKGDEGAAADLVELLRVLRAQEGE